MDKKKLSYGTNVILLCRTIQWYSAHRIILNVYHIREATHPQRHDVMIHHAFLCHNTACNPQHASHVTSYYNFDNSKYH